MSDQGSSVSSRAYQHDARAVLVFLSRESCGACMKFAPVWEDIMKDADLAKKKIEFRRFARKQGVVFPTPLEEYANWYPCLILIPYPNWVDTIETPPIAEKRLDGIVFNRDPNNPIDHIESERARPYTLSSIKEWISSNMESSYFRSKLGERTVVSETEKPVYVQGAMERSMKKEMISRSSFPRGKQVVE